MEERDATEAVDGRACGGARGAAPCLRRAVLGGAGRLHRGVRRPRRLHELESVTFEGFGKQAIKAIGASPDAFVQMAMQLAYHKTTGHVCPTYESVSMGHFLYGRTECPTPARGVQAWCEAMADRPPGGRPRGPDARGDRRTRSAPSSAARRPGPPATSSASRRCSPPTSRPPSLPPTARGLHQLPALDLEPLRRPHLLLGLRGGGERRLRLLLPILADSIQFNVTSRRLGSPALHQPGGLAPDARHGRGRASRL